MHRECSRVTLLSACGLLAASLGWSGCGGDAKRSTDAAMVADGATASDGRVGDASPGADAGREVTGRADAGTDGADVPSVVADVAPDAASADAAGDTVVCPTQPDAGAPSGTAPMQDPGPVVASSPARPQLSAAVADGEYTIARVLARGGSLTGPPTPSVVAPVDGGAIDGGGSSDGGEAARGDGGVDGGGPGAVSYALNDDWDPVTHGIGDVDAFVPLFTVAADGSGTHTLINVAITDAIPLARCGRVYIRIKAGTYREKVVVPSKSTAAMLTLYSTERDASKTVVVSGIGGNGLSASATMTVNAKTGFQMKNITVVNDYVEDAASTADQSAVALLNQSDRAQYENVRILGNIATLYLKSVDTSTAARSYFRDCTIAGDHDIVTGRGVAVFDHTEIKVLASRQATGGVITAPSTMLNNRYGFLFVSCNFTAEAGVTGVFLGRQWWESTNNGVVGKVVIRNSTLGAHIAPAPWAPSSTRTFTPKEPAGTTPVTLYTSDDYYPAGAGPSPAEIYLGEYGNTGPGAAQ